MSEAKERGTTPLSQCPKDQEEGSEEVRRATPPSGSSPGDEGSGDIKIPMPEPPRVNYQQRMCCQTWHYLVLIFIYIPMIYIK